MKVEQVGARHVCLDTFPGEIEGSRSHLTAWRMLAGQALR